MPSQKSNLAIWYPQQQVHYLRGRIQAPTMGTDVSIGHIPSNSVVTSVIVSVLTELAGGQLSVDMNGGEAVAAGDVPVTVGTTVVGSLAQAVTEETEVTVSFNGATAGDAIVAVTYVPPNSPNEL